MVTPYIEVNTFVRTPFRKGIKPKRTKLFVDGQALDPVNFTLQKGDKIIPNPLWDQNKEFWSMSNPENHPFTIHYAQTLYKSPNGPSPIKEGARVHLDMDLQDMTDDEEEQVVEDDAWAPILKAHQSLPPRGTNTYQHLFDNINNNTDEENLVDCQPMVGPLDEAGITAVDDLVDEWTQPVDDDGCPIPTAEAEAEQRQVNPYNNTGGIFRNLVKTTFEVIEAPFALMEHVLNKFKNWWKNDSTEHRISQADLMEFRQWRESRRSGQDVTDVNSPSNVNHRSIPNVVPGNNLTLSEFSDASDQVED